MPSPLSPKNARGEDSKSNLDDATRRRMVRQLQKQINFRTSPITTTMYTIRSTTNFIWSTGLKIVKHWAFYLGALPLMIIWAFLSHYPGSHTPFVEDASLTLWCGLWWLGLGILSSIGLGTGMQTGMLFLFPHILKVVYTAEECGTLDFETRTNAWFNPAFPPSQLLLMKCDKIPDESIAPSYFELVMKVLAASLVWGIGTAIGEIPPYHFAYLAASKGETDEELQAELNELENDGSNDGWATRQFNRMKKWMIKFIQENGFWGIYLMSAWPNAAFDLCGMCCGHFRMDFWTFFGALVLGKAFTLRSLQALGFVAVFSKQYRPKFIRAVGFVVPNAAEMFSNRIEDFISNVEQGGGENSSGPGLIAKLWGTMVFLLISYFIYHAAEAIAQDFVRSLDDNELRKSAPVEKEQ